VNRVAFAVVLGGVLVATGAIFVLRTSAPDDVSAKPEPAVRDLRPRPETRPAANVSLPAPRASAAPRAPAAKRRPDPVSSEPAATPPATAPRETATLRVVSDVSGAQVFLNRQFVGPAPATAADLAPGSYQLNVSAAGYDNHVETIELAPGEREVRITFREVRLNASLAVVHKHRFGSCTGTLVATTAGVRYQTTHQQDAFEAALTELETFQVDYLNKNLRIQPRKGKRYDFTDPDGNADRLFVFHRDVERARDRLKKGDTP
jgi:hypothetical protein